MLILNVQGPILLWVKLTLLSLCSISIRAMTSPDRLFRNSVCSVENRMYYELWMHVFKFHAGEPIVLKQSLASVKWDDLLLSMPELQDRFLYLACYIGPGYVTLLPAAVCPYHRVLVLPSRSRLGILCKVDQGRYALTSPYHFRSGSYRVSKTMNLQHGQPAQLVLRNLQKY